MFFQAFNLIYYFIKKKSDGVARIFSRNVQRQGTPDDLKDYEEEIAKTCVPATDLGGIKLTDLPGKEALYEPGKFCHTITLLI